MIFFTGIKKNYFACIFLEEKLLKHMVPCLACSRHSIYINFGLFFFKFSICVAKANTGLFLLRFCESYCYTRHSSPSVAPPVSSSFFFSLPFFSFSKQFPRNMKESNIIPIYISCFICFAPASIDRQIH